MPSALPPTNPPPFEPTTSFHTSTSRADDGISLPIDQALPSDKSKVKQVPRGGEAVPNIDFRELDIKDAAMGAGSFKSVYKARWAKKNRDVAVLVLRNSDSAS